LERAWVAMISAMYNDVVINVLFYGVLVPQTLYKVVMIVVLGEERITNRRSGQMELLIFRFFHIKNEKQVCRCHCYYL
jgi:hypothetical protein